MSGTCLIIAQPVHEAVLQIFAFLEHPFMSFCRLNSTGYSFYFDPSLGQMHFNVNFDFSSDYFHIHSSAAWQFMKTDKMQKNSEDRGLGARAKDHVPLCSVTGGFFWGYTKGSRFPDPEYMGNFFASFYWPPGPDAFSVIYKPCLETTQACISLTLAHTTRGQAQQSTEA